MEKRRLRPVTYAESLAAKRIAEEYETKLIQEEHTEDKNEELIDFKENSVSLVNVQTLPSGGSPYPENSRIYFSPFTFGELKFLSSSVVSDVETIDFFLSKITTSFNKNDLTFFDFYFLSNMVKISTFGDVEFKLNFVCPHCGGENSQPFNILDLEFEEIRVPIPIVVDLKKPFEISTGTIEKVTFMPMTIGNYKKLLKEGKQEDQDFYMAYCVQEGTFEDKLKIIKECFVGLDTSILESIDVNFYHGTKDIKRKCENKIVSEDGNEEVCGREIDIPFRELYQHLTPSDESKRFLSERVHFGV